MSVLESVPDSARPGCVPRGVGFALAALVGLELLARVLVASPAFHARIAWTDAGRRVAAVQRWSVGEGALAPGARLRHDRVTGWLPVPGAHEVDGVAHTVAADGTRTTAPPRAGAAELVVLGDDHVFGRGVPDDATLSRRLAAGTGAGALRVRNLAVAGHGLDQQLLRLRHEVDHADVIVVALDTPQLARTTASWDLWRKPRFEVVDGALLQVSPIPLPAPGAGDDDALAPLRLIELGRVWLDAWRLAPDQFSRAPLTPRLLDAVAERAAALDAALIVAWLPDPSPFLSDGPARMPPDLAAWCAAHGCVDGKEAFREAHRAGVALATGRGWWSAEAHRVAAEVLAEPVAAALAGRTAGR